MNDQITQQQVNQAAWAACDTFRGAVDSAINWPGTESAQSCEIMMRTY